MDNTLKQMRNFLEKLKENDPKFKEELRQEMCKFKKQQEKNLKNEKEEK